MGSSEHLGCMSKGKVYFSLLGNLKEKSLCDELNFLGLHGHDHSIFLSAITKVVCHCHFPESFSTFEYSVCFLVFLELSPPTTNQVELFHL